MGQIYDAARRRESSRRSLDSNGAGEPALVLDLRDAVGREPAVEGAEGTAPRTDPSHAVHRAESPSRSTRVDPGLVAVTAPASPAAEQLRGVRSAVRRALETRGLRTVLVTSPGRDEGKSLVAANLALLLAAEIDRRAVLVDADLRRPTIHRLFGFPIGAGVGEIAETPGAWQECTLRTPWTGLDLILAGARTERAPELLGGPGMRTFVAEVRDAYDFVVMDAPPVLPVADAIVLSGLVDGVLVVARAGWTPREALVEAIGRLGAVPILGVVVNAVPDHPLARREYYTY